MARGTKSKTSEGGVSATMIEPRATGMASAKPLGPRQVGDTVIFAASYPNAKIIQIAGDFNNWQPEKNPMKKTDNDTWEARIPLKKGVYNYRFVVDGKWQQDPHNSMTKPNPYGEMNSVIKVE